MRSGFHTGNIQPIELLDILQYLAQLRGQSLFLLGRQFNAGQFDPRDKSISILGLVEFAFHKRLNCIGSLLGIVA